MAIIGAAAYSLRFTGMSSARIHTRSGHRLAGNGNDRVSGHAVDIFRGKEMLNPGEKAPQFILENDRGEKVSLEGLLENGPLILYFYPADFTPGCTAEACSIRDIHSDIQSVGLQVAGVSPQDADSHARFREKHDLPFELLCDPDKVAAKKYDVDGPFGVGVRRTTFLIGQDGTIHDVVQADLRIGRHEEFIKKAIALRADAG
jgi:peroxiredoxin Q/BCP